AYRRRAGRRAAYGRRTPTRRTSRPGRRRPTFRWDPPDPPAAARGAPDAASATTPCAAAVARAGTPAGADGGGAPLGDHRDDPAGRAAQAPEGPATAEGHHAGAGRDAAARRLPHLSVRSDLRGRPGLLRARRAQTAELGGL